MYTLQKARLRSASDRRRKQDNTFNTLQSTNLYAYVAQAGHKLSVVFFRERARHCADSDGGRGAIGQRAFTRRRLPLREKARCRRSVASIVCQDTGGACTAAPQTVQHSLLRVSDLDRRYNEFAEYVRKYRRMAQLLICAAYSCRSLCSVHGLSNSKRVTGRSQTRH